MFNIAVKILTPASVNGVVCGHTCPAALRGMAVVMYIGTHRWWVCVGFENGRGVSHDRRCPTIGKKIGMNN